MFNIPDSLIFKAWFLDWVKSKFKAESKENELEAMKENFKPSPITVLQNTDLLIKALERSNVPIGGSCIVESVDTKIRMKIAVHKENGKINIYGHASTQYYRALEYLLLDIAFLGYTKVVEILDDRKNS